MEDSPVETRHAHRTLRRALDATALSLGSRLWLSGLCLAAATALWLPLVQFVFRPRAADVLGPPRAAGVPDSIPPRARALSARHLALWTDPSLRDGEIARMRRSNAEWDFMSRTFFCLALCNMALSEPGEKARYLEIVDRILEETLKLEREKGIYFFLMDYARARPFVQSPPRSLFVDGEIALVLGARRVVEEKPEYRPLLSERVDAIVRAMRGGPILCAESYPDECWLFCNTAALAAIRISDHLEGTDHGTFFGEWLRAARGKLIDERTGLLISSFDLEGHAIDGPEGSTIWTAAHFLQLVDADFARDQYRRARTELGRSLLGFGYAREWPVSYVGPQDVDSGPVVPLLDASPASSGLALAGAATFGDAGFFLELCASLDFAAFPLERGGELRYCASNQVGDAVMLYAMVLGPLWKKVSEGARP